MLDFVIFVEKDSEIVIVMFNWLKVMNVLLVELRWVIVEIFDDFEKDFGIWVVILMGVGKVFIVGFDFKELGVGDVLVGGVVSGEEVLDLVCFMVCFFGLIIGVINGVVIIGGFEIVFVCDVLIVFINVWFVDMYV